MAEHTENHVDPDTPAGHVTMSVARRIETDREQISWRGPTPAWHSRGRSPGFSAVAVEGAVESAVHRLSGIEGWFEPQANLTNAVRVVGAAPARWKQGVTIWLGFFPLSLLINSAVVSHLDGMPLVLKTLVATVINTPLMVYPVLPWITARLGPLAAVAGAGRLTADREDRDACEGSGDRIPAERGTTSRLGGWHSAHRAAFITLEGIHRCLPSPGMK